MEKGRKYVKALMILIYIFILSMGVYAQELPSLNNKLKLLEFSTKSEKAIIGRFPSLEVSFSSIMKNKDYRPCYTKTNSPLINSTIPLWQPTNIAPQYKPHCSKPTCPTA